MSFKTLFGKYIYITIAVTLLGTGGLFAYLSGEGIDISCELPVVCDGLTCTFYCDFYNSESQSKYIYNYDDMKITFDDESDVDIFIKYYGKYVYTNFTMETRLGNIPDDRKYVFVFPGKRTKTFKFIVYSNESKKINIALGDYNGELITWEPKFKTCFRTERLYEDNISLVPSFTDDNGTFVEEHNITNQVFMGYNDVEYVCGIRQGIEVGGTYYVNSNIQDDKLITCDVNLGDRNWNIPIRDYMFDKGVCHEVLI